MKKTIILLFIPAFCSSDCSLIPEILSGIRPGAQWSCSGNSYEGIIWNDKSQAMPTKQELDQAAIDCQSREDNKSFQKTKAIADAKDSTKDPVARIDALIKALNF